MQQVEGKQFREKGLVAEFKLFFWRIYVIALGTT